MIIPQARQGPNGASLPACIRPRQGEALVSALRPESLRRPAVDLGGWGFVGGVGGVADVRVCRGVGGWIADLDT